MLIRQQILILSLKNRRVCNISEYFFICEKHNNVKNKSEDPQTLSVKKEKVYICFPVRQ